MISVLMAPGEANREKEMRRAMAGDGRFSPLQVASDLPVDLQFSYDGKILNIELKEPQDYVGSVLDGHLTDQVFSMLEAGKDGCTVILGDQMAIYKAIQKASKARKQDKSKKAKFLTGDELKQTIASNHLRCKSFRKRSFLHGVPVFWKGDDSGFFDSDDQFKDLLELAHDYLCDGSLFGFVNRPADNMRELAAAAMLFKGIGAHTLEPVLAHYKLCLLSKSNPAVPVCDLPGIGPKRAAIIEQRIVGV